MKLKPWPKWAEVALQGVAYWIGHRRSLYPHYPLAEAALVAEACNLIHANLPDALELRCEILYRKLCKTLPAELAGRARVDLAVGEKQSGKKMKLRYVIEVKRASAATATINADLKRLAAFLEKRPSVRAFLFVLSEAHRPRRFVTDEGASIKGEHAIPNSNGVYRVRRTLKAAHVFNVRDKAIYACLIEVFGSK